MCQFLSAIVTRDGRVLTHPATDSHEQLIQHFGLREGPAPEHGECHFAKVEFTPKDSLYDDPAAYSLRIDEDIRPGWFDAEREEATSNELRSRIERMIIRTKRAVLLDGCWIITDGADVGQVILARTFIKGGTVNAIEGGTVNAIEGGTVNAIWGGTVNAIRGGTVNAIWGGTVNAIWGGTVNAIWGGTVNAIEGGTVMRDLRNKK